MSERVLVEVDAIDNATSKLNSIKNSISSLSSVVGSVTSLSSAFMNLGDIQDNVTKQAIKVQSLNLQLKKDYDDLSKIINKYGENSEEAKNKLEEIRITEEKLKLANSDLEKSQMQLSFTYISTFTNIGNLAIQLASNFSGLTSAINAVGLASKLAFITNPVGLAIMGIASAVLILSTNMFGLRDAFFSVLEKIYEFLKNIPIIGNIITTIAAGIKGLLDLLQIKTPEFSMPAMPDIPTMSGVTGMTGKDELKSTQLVNACEQTADTSIEIKDNTTKLLEQNKTHQIIQKSIMDYEAKIETNTREQSTSVKKSAEYLFNLTNLATLQLDAMKSMNSTLNSIGRDMSSPRTTTTRSSSGGVTSKDDSYRGGIPKGYVGMETYENRRTGEKYVTYIKKDGTRETRKESISVNTRSQYR